MIEVVLTTIAFLIVLPIICLVWLAGHHKEE